MPENVEDLPADVIEACHKRYGPDVDPWPVVTLSPIYLHKLRSMTIDHPDFPRTEFPAGTRLWVYGSWQFMGPTHYRVTDGKGLFGEVHWAEVKREEP